MLIHLVSEASIPNVVQAHELIEPIRASVRQDETIESNGETCFSKRLHRCRLSEYACASRNKYVTTVV